MVIARFPLFQVGAPHVYSVTDEEGHDHQICGWDGHTWHRMGDTISDEDQGDHGGPDSLPAAGSIPASSNQSLNNESNGAARGDSAESRSCDLPAKTGTGHVSKAKRKDHPRPSPLSGGGKNGNAPGLQRVTRATLPRIDETRSQAVGTSRGSEAPKCWSNDQPAQFTSDSTGLSKRTFRKDVELTGPIAILHAALDTARAKFGQAATDDRRDEYHRCIAAVDVADPGFYLGRVNPLSPLVRYIPPDLDYAGISSRMTFTEIVVRDEEQEAAAPPTCRKCGCTDDDCADCIARTGSSCYWVEPDLCSACAPEDAKLQN